MRLALNDDKKYASAGLLRVLSATGDACILIEGIQGAFQVGLLLTDDAGMAKINLARRGIDEPTDVLSFPGVSYPCGTARDHPSRLRREWDADTGCVHLGDIALSVPKARAQAEAYGHSFLREICFLFAHGMLHLLGHDHPGGQAGAPMRALEEAVMKRMGLVRELSQKEREMVDCAREALQNAYARYSGYRVGACVQDSNGRLFKGCNVENASFGMTVCAERNAIAAAVTEGARRIRAIAIVTENEPPSPCGACRQFMREFAGDMKVILSCADGARVTSLSALLPESFGPESLEENTT